MIEDIRICKSYGIERTLAWIRMLIVIQMGIDRG